MQIHLSSVRPSGETNEMSKMGISLKSHSPRSLSMSRLVIENDLDRVNLHSALKWPNTLTTSLFAQGRHPDPLWALPPVSWASSFSCLCERRRVAFADSALMFTYTNLVRLLRLEWTLEVAIRCQALPAWLVQTAQDPRYCRGTGLVARCS